MSSNGDFEFEWDDNTKTLTLTLTKTSLGSDWTKGKNITYTFSAPLATVNGQKYTVDDIIVTHNDKIEYRQEWVGEPKLFTDEIYIKAEKVYGLNLPTDDHINSLIDAKLNSIPLASNETEGF